MSVLLLVLCCSSWGGSLSAQPVIPVEDSALFRRLDSLQDLVEAEQWDRALDLIDGVSSSGREQVVRVNDDYYLNAAEYARLLLTRLPEAAQERARQRKQSQATLWLKEGREQRDPRQLSRLVTEAFLTREAEEAILLLGEWSLQGGEFASARRYWTMLVPLDPQVQQRTFLARLPDPKTPLADVLARLVLCSLLEGNRARAEEELAIFSARFPEAKGTLAGQTATWTSLLEAELDALTSPSELAATEQDQSRDVPLDVGTKLWSLPISPEESQRTEPQSVVPVVWQNLILWNTHRNIMAFERMTGFPAWIGSAPLSREELIRKGSLTPLPRPGEFVPSTRSVWGNSAGTLTVANGRLYAVLGGPVTAYVDQEPRVEPSRLVCLALERGQGLLLWETMATALDRLVRFEGTPLVVGERVYLLGRRGRVPSELHLICLNATNGTYLWNRLICSNSPLLPDGQHLAGRAELTREGETLYVNTDLGCVAAFEKEAGRPLWYRVYPRDDEAADARHQHDMMPNRCLVYEGFLIALPSDGNELLVLDGLTGETIWTESVAPGRELLSVNRHGVFLSGDSLSCLSLETGRERWSYTPGPGVRSSGTSLLSSAQVWWPTPTEILIFESASGTMRRRVVLRDRYGVRGGNLLSDGVNLIVAGPHDVTLFSPFGTLPAKKNIPAQAE